jgi:hypothetical protein
MGELERGDGVLKEAAEYQDQMREIGEAAAAVGETSPQNEAAINR